MKTTFAYILGSTVAFFAPVAGIMYAIGVFILLDTFLGIMAAQKLGEKIESRKLSKVVWKMLMYQAVTLSFFVMDVHIVGDLLGTLINTPYVLTKTVGVALIAIEFKSIDENIEKMTGTTLLKRLYDLIAKGKDIANKRKFWY
jgi:phage-related holin